MEAILGDLRLAARSLIRSPAYTLIAVVALALGIGANTAIFSVVNAVLLRPLPFHEAERLVVLWESNLKLGQEQSVASNLNLRDWSDQSARLEELAAWMYWGHDLTGGVEPEALTTVRAWPNLFRVLGVEPALGRPFSEDDVEADPRVAILSHGLWVRLFGADPAVLDRPIVLDGESYTVLGVMPRQFRFPDDDQVALWVPFVPQPWENRRSGRQFRVIARLADGATLAQARAELGTIAARLEAEYPESNGGWGVTIEPLRDRLAGTNRFILVLFGAVFFVLLIACVNVANLQLVRALDREREIAVRSALGARRAQLVRQLLAESFVLALLGGAVGLLLAASGIDLLLALSQGGAVDWNQAIPGWNPVRLDATVLLFTLLAAVVVALLSGVVPAFQASRPDLNEALKEGSGHATTGSRPLRARNVLVIAEVTMAFVLVVGAGLLIHSFARLLEVDRGFDPQGVLTAHIDLPRARYAEDAQQIAFFKELLGRLESLPGVQEAALVTALPMNPVSVDFDLPVTVVDRPVADSDLPQADFRSASPGYFRALRVPLVAGRTFTDRDRADAPRVMVINQAMARRLFAPEDPIGKRVQIPMGGPATEFEIVGVVSDVRHRGLDADFRPEMFVSHEQVQLGAGTLVLRTAGDPLEQISSLKDTVYALDPEQPVAGVATLDQLVEDSVADRRFNVILLGIFAAVGLVLATIGVYGLIAYSVSRRRHEIGIRLALGAHPRDILRLVVGQAMRLTTAGIVIGVAVALAVCRVLRGFLYGVAPTDPVTYAAVAVLFAIVAFFAGWVPARRAARIEPMIALRYE